MTERQAYAKATSEFYEIRAQQEEAERQARSQLNAAMEQVEKPWTKLALELEEKAIKEGQEKIMI